MYKPKHHEHNIAICMIEDIAICMIKDIAICMIEDIAICIIKDIAICMIEEKFIEGQKVIIFTRITSDMLSCSQHNSPKTAATHFFLKPLIKSLEVLSFKARS